MSYFHFTTVALLLIWYLILVLSVDITASYLRRLAR
jgi:ABC-type phosphate/phosphonate transport system permease subunit